MGNKQNDQMKINIGDKIVSDDHCAIGVLTKVMDKLVVVGDFGTIDYEPYCSDWQHYDVWKRNLE